MSTITSSATIRRIVPLISAFGAKSRTDSL
jgi:hypothetical protein